MYTTIDGDTWDKIAKKVYGEEIKTDFLMDNNRNLLDILVFSSGVVVNTLPLPIEKSRRLPDWR